MTVWILWACRFYLALQASQADRPQDASMTLQIRMTASCENEIVTLRGGMCLVVGRKPKSHHGDAEARRRAGDWGRTIAKHQQNLETRRKRRKARLEPQRTPLRKLRVAQGRLRNTEANPHRGDAE